MHDANARLRQVFELITAGRHEQARASLQRMLRSDPNNAALLNAMAYSLTYSGQQEQALYYADRAVQAAPDDVDLLNNLGTMRSRAGRPDLALPPLERAVSLRPDYAPARINLGNALFTLNRCTESVAHPRVAAQLTPGDVGTTAELMNKLQTIARAEEAVDLARSRAHAAAGHMPLARSLATALLNDPRATPRDVFVAHSTLGGIIAAQNQTMPRRFSNAKDAERPLRLGFVSPDFRSHSVSYFVERILAGLDRDRASVACYACSPLADETTARLRAAASAWRQIDALPANAAADRIIADGMDVLVDLAGHTNGARPEVFQLRAAPVQITYCGYPATTGLSQMDWRMVDAVTDPVGAEDWATERLLRLSPVFLCFRPPPEAPGESPRGEGPVTFGSFNALSKLNEAVISLWSRLIAAVPGSRLLLKGRQIADTGVCDDLRRRFGAQGVAPERLDLLAATPGVPEHLALYGRMDIGLDPFPYNGTTTTCEALWMGVPVVTLAGEMHAGRVGTSLLSAAGLPELIARTPEQYVEIAARLAGDRPRRARLRTELRQRFAASPLNDEAGFCRAFEGAVRNAWRAWCGAPA